MMIHCSHDFLITAGGDGRDHLLFRRHIRLLLSTTLIELFHLLSLVTPLLNFTICYTESFALKLSDLGGFAQLS